MLAHMCTPHTPERERVRDRQAESENQKDSERDHSPPPQTDRGECFLCLLYGGNPVPVEALEDLDAGWVV